MKANNMLLSIGIIFKNEIRCLERCLKSFQPLKEALPGQVEIVMADTGSDDGSREIAAKYADVLFEFPWVNDFSAARNAVMDRCSGQWFFTVDADEWLDEDISQLLAFMRVCDRAPGNQCTMVVRNYATAALDWNYVEFMGTRMVRMSTGARYFGRIHERFNLTGDALSYNTLDKVILHHDGYVCLNDGSAEGVEKTARNMELIDKGLKADPHNMRLMMQRLDCFNGDPEKVYDYVERILPGVQEHWTDWETAGPHIFRHGTYAAKVLGRPKFWEWVALAEELFPDSIFVRLDVQFYATEHAWNEKNYAETVTWGMRYLQALKDYHTGNFNQAELATGILQTARPHVVTSLRSILARACLYEGRTEDALEALQELDYDSMDTEQTGTLSAAMLRLHAVSTLDTAPLVKEFWEGISRPKPTKEAAKARRETMISACAGCFSAQCREEEAARILDPSALLSMDLNVLDADQWSQLNKLPACRYSYTLFLPLAGQCELGTAAAVLNSDDPAEIAALLAGTERIQELPISALIHALERGTAFPLKEKPLNLEEMDSLAGRLVRSDGRMARRAAELDMADVADDPQSLCWVRGLVLAAVQVFPWNGEDAEQGQGIALARSFAKMERVFLPRCYAPEVLDKVGLFLLPPMHRFGWYCAQAFDALDGGDAAGYVRLLREGLAACEGVKDMVEFLIDHTPELKDPSDELKAMAEQIRAVLANFAPDDPAVAALKQSEAYQKVAYLIEGLEPPVAGGLVQ